MAKCELAFTELHVGDDDWVTPGILFIVILPEAHPFILLSILLSAQIFGL
jgi:hypothetical protein